MNPPRAMKGVVINLAGQTERWDRAQAQFERLGLAAVRFEAVLGRALPEAERDRLYSQRLNRAQYHQPLTPGEIGCYASHLAVWRGMVESHEPFLGVFEDDLELAPDLPGILSAIAALPPRWDMIKLVGRRVESGLRRRPLTPSRALLAYRRVPSSTGAYVISLEGAEKLLARRIPFGRPVDVDLRFWWECDLRVYGVDPYPVAFSTAGDTTSIVGRRVAPSWGRRFRRWRQQLAYLWNNARANRRARAGEGLFADGER